MSGLSMNY
jgi:hypothetical protein